MSKVCTICAANKELYDFYQDKSMADGHWGQCIECVKVRAAEYRKANGLRIRAYHKTRSQLPHRKAKKWEYDKTYRKRYPLRYRASSIVKSAIRNGRLHKSNVCVSCGAIGRTHGHHADYHKPLNVKWLCQTCHITEHKKVG